MTSKTAARRTQAHRREALAALRRAGQRRRRRRGAVVSVAVVVVLAGVVTAMMLSARPTSSTARRTAPDFTLTDTSGKQVHLASLRGRTVVLYFSECLFLNLILIGVSGAVDGGTPGRSGGAKRSFQDELGAPPRVAGRPVEAVVGDRGARA